MTSTVKNMLPEDEAEMWKERSFEMEEMVVLSIETLKVLRDRGTWPQSQRDEINRVLHELEVSLVPF